MSDSLPKNIITARPDNLKDYLLKVWRHRQLITAIALRDLKVKYSQTVFGLAWSIIQPATAITVFTFFFGYILNWNTGQIPYPLYVYSGLIGWNFFSYIINAGSTSIFESSHLIKKIYFPKVVLPLSKVIVATSELCINLVLFIGMLFFYRTTITYNILILPFAYLHTAVCGLTIVIWVVTFAYRKKDLLHSLPFISYFGIWVTPVFFSMNIIPAHIRFLFDINPMTSSINIWRWGLLNQGEFSLMWIISFLITFLLFVVGVYFYNLKENDFSDYV
jgi:lipopolysaccharide transport system permease protein